MSGESWITFLSDYGLDDHFVGVCKGVIARIAPQAKIIDICHEVKAQSVSIGASILAEALPYQPSGVHLALVDPYRSSGARGVAVRCADGSTIVCPDNGVSSLAWPVLGGAVAARELTNPELRQPNPARSFRGRDVFAPVAAHLLAGVPFERVGDEVSVDSLNSLTPIPPYVHGDHVHGAVRMVDHFGNLALNVRRSDVEAAGITQGDVVELRCGGKDMRVPFAAHFGDVTAGRTVICEDSFRAITVAVNMGHASTTLGLGPGDPIVLSRVHYAPFAPPAPVGVVDEPPVPGVS